jgi:hypothetical protein
MLSVGIRGSKTSTGTSWKEKKHIPHLFLMSVAFNSYHRAFSREPAQPNQANFSICYVFEEDSHVDLDKLKPELQYLEKQYAPTPSDCHTVAHSSANSFAVYDFTRTKCACTSYNRQESGSSGWRMILGNLLRACIPSFSVYKRHPAVDTQYCINTMICAVYILLSMSRGCNTSMSRTQRAIAGIEPPGCCERINNCRKRLTAES